MRLSFLHTSIISMVLTATASLALANAHSSSTGVSSTSFQSQTLQQSVEQSSEKAALSADKWSEWGLNQTDWLRYEKLKNSPSGVLMPNLDPLTLLGIEARSENEAMRYAELLAKVEFERNEKILKFQRFYDQAFSRLYPNIQPFKVDETGNHSVNINNRVFYFTRSDCGQKCDDDLKKILASVGDSPLDIYLVDSEQSDEKIRQWALAHRIDAEKVRQRQITLNHDSGMWLKNANGRMPVAFKISGSGEWQRIAY